MTAPTFVRRAWLALGSLTVVVVIGMSTFLVVNVVAHEEISERRTFPVADVDALDLRSDNGRVVIAGGDVDEITVVAEVDHGLRRTAHRAEVQGRTLVVRDDCPTGVQVWCRVDYEILVPADLLVTAMVENGRLTVRDLATDLTVSSDNGTIELVRIGGDVDARTKNGSVRARGLTGDDLLARSENGSIEVSFTESPGFVDARTSNGSIDLVVPDDERVVYRVDTSVFAFGETDVGIRTDRDSDHIILAATFHGSVTIRYPAG
jgi:hypothetical protein